MHAETSGKKGKFKARSMDFNVESGDETLSGDGFSGKKRKKKKGFIKRIKEFFHVDSNPHSKADITYGTSFDHPDDKEKPPVNVLSLHKDQPEISLNLSTTSQNAKLSPSKTPKPEQTKTDSNIQNVPESDLSIDFKPPQLHLSLNSPEKSHTITTTKIIKTVSNGEEVTKEEKTVTESKDGTIHTSFTLSESSTIK